MAVFVLCLCYICGCKQWPSCSLKKPREVRLPPLWLQCSAALLLVLFISCAETFSAPKPRCVPHQCTRLVRSCMNISFNCDKMLSVWAHLLDLQHCDDDLTSSGETKLFSSWFMKCCCQGPDISAVETHQGSNSKRQEQIKKVWDAYTFLMYLFNLYLTK